ncbi:MAG: DinB family protein [Dehalococcoidia bacterium]|nr:DinB family protein [Dehalococcoidia bacterium]
MTIPEVAAAQALLFDGVDRVIAGTAGLDTAGLNWHPPAPDSNSLHAIATHLLGGTEQLMMSALCRVRPTIRDREAELRSESDGNVTFAARWATLRPDIERALDALTEADLADQRPHPRLGPMDGRELLWRTVAHANEHAGHVELTRQLLDAR